MVPDGRIIKSAMMIGYPQFEVHSIPRRKPVEIIWR